MDCRSVEENFDDDMFDLNPIVPEIYGSDQPASSHERFLECSFTAEQTFTPFNPSSSSASPSPPVFASATPSGLITFDNMNVQSSDGSDRFRHELTSPDREENSLESSLATILDFSNDSVGGKKVKGAAANVKNREPRGVRCTPVMRSTWQAQEHVIAERKRREKMTQLFISLSKVLPGIKKLDKASLLEDAINYTRNLQERIRLLEEERASMTNSTASKAIDNEPEVSSCSPPPAIKVRISDRTVLIRMCCKNIQKGLMPRIHMEMERMNLSVTDLRIIPFGANTFSDITILAQMQSGVCSTLKDIVDQLEVAFFHPLDVQN